VEPDLGRFLTAEEREQVRGVTVPVLAAGPGKFDLESRLRASDAFGALILTGVLVQRLVVGDHPGLRLLGPGDVLSRQSDAELALVARSTHRAVGELRLALLDDRVLVTAQRFPRLFAGLYTRMGDQHQRLAAQLVICQLPRVEDRILAMLWLLAETWGHVTPSGTVLPVALTHDALGECVGARRPTVSLALKELADRGAVLRQNGGWVLLEPPPGGAGASPPRLRDGFVEVSDDAHLLTWSDSAQTALPELQPDALRSLIVALRETHSVAQRDTERRLTASRGLREHNVALREQLATSRRRQRPAP
jgi:CRP-like cAMP-binding protein